LPRSAYRAGKVGASEDAWLAEVVLTERGPPVRRNVAYVGTAKEDRIVAKW
jgi:hypothetical protein